MGTYTLDCQLKIDESDQVRILIDKILQNQNSKIYWCEFRFLYLAKTLHFNGQFVNVILQNNMKSTMILEDMKTFRHQKITKKQKLSGI